MFDTSPNFPQKYFSQELAIRAEALARQLSNIPPAPSETTERDLMSILQSICDLLEHLLEQPLMASTNDFNHNQPEDIAPVEQPPEELASAMSEITLAPSPAHQPVSATVHALIKLSDWVLFAKAEGTAVRPEVLEEIYKQLIGVLAKEDVTILQADGPCDYERQMVVGTCHTDDATIVDHVCSTVRPGYLFHEQLLRPQEVIVYIR